jgi:membrane protease subunit HflK
MVMSGLDRGNATGGPANDGLGVAKHDSPWAGPEAATAASEAVPDEALTGDESPETEAPAAATPTPRPANPWHHSRPKRRMRPVRQGATGAGSVAAPALLRRLGRFPLPQISPPPGRVWAPWLVGALALVWLGATSLHPVGPREQAIVATFGASGPALGPGLAVSWPWPIGSVHIADVTSVRHLALPDGDGEQLMLTSDGGLVDLAADVRWRIRDLRRHDFGLADPDATLQLAAQTALRESVAGLDFVAVMGRARETLGRDAAQRLQALLDRDRAGIVIDGVDIRRVDPPAHVADALRTVAAARSDAANEAIQAQGWSRQLIAHAQGEAGAFDKVHAQYRLAPAVIRRQIYYDTMERVLSQSDKVIVDAPGTVIPLAPIAVPGSQAPPGGAKAGHGD